MSNSFVGEYAIFDNGANNIPLNKLKINFNPIQTGSGDPSPTNVRPIIGFDRARVSVTKENIFDFHTLVRGRGYSTPAYEFTENGVHMMYGGSSQYIGLRGPLILTEGVTYRISCNIIVNSLTGETAIAIRRMAGSTILRSFRANNIGEYNASFTYTHTGEPVYLMLFGNMTPGGPFDVEYKNISVSPIKVNAVGKKYFGKNYDILFGNDTTVYGGTLDVLSGDLTIKKGHIDSYNGETLDGEWISSIDVYEAGTNPSTGAEVVYDLETPTVIKVSPIDVASLLGFNQIVAKAYNTISSISNELFPQYNDGKIDIEWKEAKYIDNNSSYTDLVTSEFEKSTKFMSYLETFLDMISPSVNNLKSFDELFDIDNLVGDRLDIIGSLIGISRELPIDDSNIPSILSDQTYRLVLKAKILKNHWDGTYEGLVNIVNDLFPGIPIGIIDNQDMSYSVIIISSEISDEVFSLISNGYIFPKPAGVRVNYTIYDSVAFGWDSDTELIKGWNLGVWGNS